MPADVKSQALDELLGTIWRRLKPLLGQDLEANVEYSWRDNNYYVRIPWQLYLIAMLAKRNRRLFFSSSVQERLTAIVEAVKRPAGFFYLHSGRRISTRTNAILFDALTLIEANFPAHPFRYRPVSWIDAVQTFLGQKWLRRVATAVGLLASAILVWNFIASPNGSLGLMGGAVIAGICVLLVSGGRQT